MVSNYFSRWYVYTINAINVEQQNIEEELFAAQEVVEKKALEMLNIHRPSSTMSTPRASPSSRRDLNTLSLAAKESVGIYLAKFHEETAIKSK